MNRLPLRSLEEAEAVGRHLPLVRAIAARYMGRGAEPEDLFQLGCIGLIKALRDFDPGYGTCFSTYAVPKIAGEMRRFLRDDGPVKVSRTLRSDGARVAAAAEQLRQQLGREPRLSELQEHTGLEPERIAQCAAVYLPVRSLEEPAGEDRPLADTLPAPGEEQRLEKLALRAALEGLDPPLRDILVCRYFLDLTQQKTGARLGLSQVQVSRLEKKALLALRAKMT